MTRATADAGRVNLPLVGASTCGYIPCPNGPCSRDDGTTVPVLFVTVGRIAHYRR